MTHTADLHDHLVPSLLVGPAMADATGDDRWRTFTTSLITGGKSNLTFRLTSAAGTAVLRRPPTGTLLPSAHDMGREIRVQSALAKTDVPVPSILLGDSNGEVFGTPFYVMGDVTGHVISHEIPADYFGATDAPARLSDALVDTLAALHSVDPARIGLGEFGRPAGFMARQVRRWRGQWEATRTRDIPDVDRLADRLEKLVPATHRHSIVHGDYRIDNCLFDLVDPGRIRAVLDWEMATLGDPLADVGMLLFYWRHADEPQPVVTPAITQRSGFPTRDHVIERYAATTGIDPEHLTFYEAFAHFKFASIVQGIAARATADTMAGQEFGDLTPEVERISAAGLALLPSP